MPSAGERSDLQRRAADTVNRARAYSEGVLEAHGGAFVQFVAFPNLSCAHRAVSPSGGVAVHKAAERVVPDFLDENMHCGVALYRVVGDVSFDAAGAAEAILTDETNTRKPTLAHREETAAGVQDRLQWDAYLDRPSAFVGLYHTTIRSTGHPPVAVHVVAVHAGAGQVASDLYDEAERCAADGVSWEVFAASPAYHYCESIAKRNRNRLAHQFAARIGVRLQAIRDFCAQGDAPLAEAGAEADASADAVVEHALYGEMAELAAEARFDLLLDLADANGVELTAELNAMLLEDPLGEQAGNPHVAAPTAAADKPFVATPFSETVYNDVLISGTTACVCLGVKSLASISAGHGVAQLLSPVEGINVLHGKDADSSADSPFGNACRGGALAGAPVTTGRLLATAEVDWDECAVGQAGVRRQPFLAWDGQSADPPRLNDKALWGERCPYRPRDAAFIEQEHRLGLKDERGVPLGNTRLDPVFVVCAPTPKRRFRHGEFPKGEGC